MNSITGINNKGLLIGIAIFIVVGVLGSYWILQPSWQPVLGASGNELSRSEVQAQLMQWDIPHKIDEATGFILVPGAELQSVRQRLSTFGIPADQQPGMELFNDIDYGMSDFTQRINYQRAIEAEISKTIRSFLDARSVRVHLTVPRESIFKERQEKPKASVIIKKRYGQKLDEYQLQGVVHIVSSAVEGLSHENVVVLDEKGNAMTKGLDGLRAAESSGTSNIEKTLEVKAIQLISGILPSSDIRVAVSVIINNDQIKSVREEIIPKSETNSGHTWKRISQDNATDSGGDKKGSLEKSSNVEEEYIFSTEKYEIKHAVGRLERITVGVVITRDINQQQLQDIRNVLASGLGLALDRGDQLTVISGISMISKNAPVSIEASNDLEGKLAEELEDRQSQSITRSSKVGGNPESNVSRETLRFKSDLNTNSIPFLLLVVFLILAISSVIISIVFHRRNNLSEEERKLLLEKARDWIAADKEREINV